MTPQFVLPYQVMYYDTDCGGVVHNLAYLRWVEECRTKMSTAIGMESVEKSSIYFRFEVRRAENDKLCVTVRQRLAVVQMPQGRPCRIPAEWQALATPPQSRAQ